MNKKFYIFLLFFLIFGLEFTVVNAIKLIEDNNRLIIEAQTNNSDVGAFSLSLSFNPDKTRIINISGEEPFITVANVKNGMIKISGFHGQIPGPSGNVRLAVVTFNGSSEFQVVELKIYNTKGNLIEFIPSSSSEGTTTAENDIYSTPTPVFEQTAQTSPVITPSPIKEEPTSTPNPERTRIYTPDTEKTQEIKETEKLEPNPTVTATQTESDVTKKELEIPGFSILSSLFAVLLVYISLLSFARRSREKVKKI